MFGLIEKEKKVKNISVVKTILNEIKGNHNWVERKRNLLKISNLYSSVAKTTPRR
jgi:hypothetical protein